MENTKDAFLWLKDNYSTLTESEYTELTDKWGKLKVYCPIAVDEESLYELNELSFYNDKWEFKALGTESDESKLNSDYPIIPKSEPLQIDFDNWEYDESLYTVIDGAVKDESVCAYNGPEVVKLTEEELAALNSTTEESSDSLTDETLVVEESPDIAKNTEETFDVIEEVETTNEENTESIEESIETEEDNPEETSDTENIT